MGQKRPSVTPPHQRGVITAPHKDPSNPSDHQYSCYAGTHAWGSTAAGSLADARLRWSAREGSQTSGQTSTQTVTFLQEVFCLYTCAVPSVPLTECPLSGIQIR